MATTYLDIVNRCLIRLGENQLPGSSVSLETDYQFLLGEMIMDIKEEVEDATNWRALRQVVSVAIAGNGVSATVTEGNERSRLVRIYQSDSHRYLPLVQDITDANNPDPLIEMDLSELLYRDQLDPDLRVDYPSYFALDNSSDGDELDFYVWPRPSAGRTIQATFCIPQARLTGSADVSTVIKVPSRPIIIGALWHAYEERGEELGPDALFSEKRFNEALQTAVAREEAESGNPFELVAL